MTLEEHMRIREKINRAGVRAVIARRGVNEGALHAVDEYWRWADACALAQFRRWRHR